MGAVRYLYVRTFVNRVRKALRRPGTYVHLVILGFYIFALPFSLKMVTEQAGMDSPQGMAAVLTVYALWVIPANLIAYARRKGWCTGRAMCIFCSRPLYRPKVCCCTRI